MADGEVVVDLGASPAADHAQSRRDVRGMVRGLEMVFTLLFVFGCTILVGQFLSVHLIPFLLANALPLAVLATFWLTAMQLHTHAGAVEKGMWNAGVYIHRMYTGASDWVRRARMEAPD